MRRATFKNTIILFVWPSKFCISIVFIFPWDHCKSQENMETIIAFLAAARKAWKFRPERGFETWPLPCRCCAPSVELSVQLSKLNARFSVLLTLAVMLCYLSSSDKKAWIIQGPVSRKSRELFGPEKSFVKLRPACSIKLVFSYVVRE